MKYENKTKEEIGYDELMDELPVCEDCGSILAHPCDCQIYNEVVE